MTMMMMMMQSKDVCKVSEQMKGGEIGSFAFAASAFFLHGVCLVAQMSMRTRTTFPLTE